MKSRLFWRLFCAMMSVLLVTIILFTALLTSAQRNRLQDNYETEVRMQARQVAEYMQQLNNLSLVRGNVTIQYLVNKKIADIYDRYNADIWIVSFESGSVQYIDRSWNTSQGIYSEAVLLQLGLIQSGQEIRATGLFEELGDHIVTIGVPWTYSDNHVVGAVLLHIPVDRLHVSLRTVLSQAMIPVLVALLLGIVLCFWAARSQTTPLREIESAVTAFSRGDLTRRVNLHCGGELEQLGNAINRMAAELGNLEQSRRSFVANVSHELRSPMTSIKGYISAMLDGTIAPGDQEKYLRVVLDETNRLSDLVRDLLDLSRLESGKFPMTIAPFDANELMRRILIGFEGRINEKGIDVEVEFADDPCYVLGDTNRINQVVRNFVDNAVKFMIGDGSVLTMQTQRVDKSVVFRVIDNGPGINPEDQMHIFDRFYKADKAHTAGMGTGLGLSICKNIIQQHGSDIRFESRPGHTVFEFALPATDKPQAEPPARLNAAAPAATERTTEPDNQNAKG